MVNLSLLNRKIKYEGIKLNVISYRIGISRTTLWSRLKGKSEFTIDEIKLLCEALHLTDEETKRIMGISPKTNDIPKWLRGKK